MSIDKQLITIAANQEKVYNAGYEKGKAEGGIDYDIFWDSFQNYGNPVSYEVAFVEGRMPNELYNPKYPIVCSSSNTSARFMYHNNTTITDTKVPIDVTAITTSNVLSNTFSCFGSNYKSSLETIAELIVAESTDYPNAFMNCNKLKNITITGTIGKSIDFKWSPLNQKSIESVYEALSTTTTGQTCTFKKTAVNAAFTDEEWKALTDAKSNWTFTLV